MKLLITGGCGFIGSNFILNKINLDNNVIINVDKLTYAGNKSNLDSLKNNKNYSFYKADINDQNFVESLLFKYKPDAIINFAAESHVDRSIDDSSDFIKTNVIGTFSLLQASLAFYRKLTKNFKFIQISTDEVFGSLESYGKFDENTPYSPRSPYSATKASSDHLVRAWYNTYNLPVLITNCSNNFGPFQFPEKLIPLMISNCIDEKPLPVYGTGFNIRDWIHVDDHCNAIYEVVKSGKIGETYLIGADNELKNIDIVKKICTIMDELAPRSNEKSYLDLISYVEDRPGHDARYAINFQKISEKLNWRPSENFDDSLKKTIIWYLNNEGWWRKIQKNNYHQERLGKL